MKIINAGSWKTGVVIFFAALCGYSLKAQIGPNEVLRKVDTVRGTQLTSLKTNTLAEVLQASINNGILSGTASGVNLKSTVFGLKKLFNPGISIDTQYREETFSRNFELGFGVKIDNNNAINGVSGSLKYAIINHRDLNVYDNKVFSKKARAISDNLFRADSERVGAGND